MGELFHYGTPRHSGRYPWGSGENPYQHGASSFLETVDSLKNEGMSEKEIADYMSMSIKELRAKKSVALSERRAALYSEALRLKDKGYSNVAIGERLGMSESSVRSLLDPVIAERQSITNNVCNVLKDAVENKQYIDISEGTEAYLGISRTKMNTAVQKLVDEGYTKHKIQFQQLGTGNKTTMYVLAAPDVTTSEVAKHKDQIQLITDYKTNDGGRTFRGLEEPTSVSSSRVQIVYNEEGGIQKDGVIELRRGVEELSLGNASYAQVRIAVDGTHYMKGMAVYSDDLPDGIDIRFNTNKHEGTPMLGEKNNTVLKPLKDDPDNPFGSSLRMDAGVIVGQRHYTDANGKDQLSPINIVREEGDWNNWSKTLASQFLSKQYPQVAKQQLDITYKKYEDEFGELKNLTNPEVKANLLQQFADECDSAAVHLKAAAFPRQASKVILPLPDLDEGEIYAPTYRDGEKVALVRYPHGGTFEIPVLTVNNKQKSGLDIIGNGIDAVGINSKVAERLSGADFDGDTVTVIPVDNVKIKATAPLEGLKDFDPKEMYPAVDGMKKMTRTNYEMGVISNLITDMTIQGATEAELARAVRHSMVVIDAEKHNLNYKQSEIDNDIAGLKKKYQGGGGATTLISSSKSEIRIPERVARGIDKETGEIKWVPTNRTYEVTKKVTDSETGKPKINPDTGKPIYIHTGKYKQAETTTTKMANAKDAHELSTGTRIENIYADYANSLKALASKARLEQHNVEPTKVNAAAKETYKGEVASLKAQLDIAKKNQPLERQAQILANTWVGARIKDNPSVQFDADEYTKLKNQTLMEARNRVGASSKDSLIQISDSEWDAIQAGAVSSTMIREILERSDKDRVRDLATPKAERGLSDAQKSKIESLYNSGYTLADIADAVGVSVTTVSNQIG